MNKILKSACIVNRENGGIMDKSIQRLLEEPDTEILVVDNNSQDNTKEILKSMIIIQKLNIGFGILRGRLTIETG